MHRGAFAIACNLGTEAVDVPVTGEVVLAWDEPTVDAKPPDWTGIRSRFCAVKSPSTGARLWITDYRENARSRAMMTVWLTSTSPPPIETGYRSHSLASPTCGNVGEP